jgi:hypothetical protein
MMKYGLQIMNGDSKIAISTDDAPLIVTRRYTLTQSGGPNGWASGPYIPGPPYDISFDTETASGGNALYTFNLPAGLTLVPGMFVGFRVPVGRSIFVRNLYNPTSRFITANTTSIGMVVAEPLPSLSNYTSKWGMILYNANGQPIYHSDARVMRVLKKIDDSGVFNAEGFSPYFFFSGNYFYWVNTSGNRFLYLPGIRLLTAGTFDRRIYNLGAALVADTNWEPDPLGNGFIGLVNDNLF